MRNMMWKHRSWVSLVLIWAIVVVPLAGCGGSTSGGGGMTLPAGASQFDLQAALAKLPRIEGQNGQSAVLSGNAALTAPVAGARVVAYAGDGTVLGETTTDANGAFVVAVLLDQLQRLQRVPQGAVGLSPLEFRVVVDIPNTASEAAGTTLSADSDNGFVHVSNITTVLSRLRQRVPTLTLASATATVKRYYSIPADVSIDDVGGDVSPFSNRVFETFAQTFNAGAGQPGGLDEDAYMDAEVGRIVASLTAGGKQALAHAGKVTTPTGTAGVDGTNPDNNTDPSGSNDPDQFKKVEPAATFTSTAINGDYCNNVVDNLTTANASFQSLVATTIQIFEFKGLLDAASGNNGVSKWTKILSYGGMVLSVIAFAFDLAAIISGATAEDPYLKALSDLSVQVQQGFNNLSNQLNGVQAYLDFRITESGFAAKLNDIKAQLARIEQLIPPAPAKTQVFQTFSVAQANTLSVQGSAKGIEAETSLSGNLNGTGARNAPRLGNQAYSKLYTYDTTPLYTPWEVYDYPFRSNRVTLFLRPIVMQYVNGIDYAEQLDATESKTALNQFSSSATALQNLSNRFLGGSQAFGTGGLSALRRRGLQQAPPRFASDKIWVDARQQLAWSTEVLTQRFNDSNTYIETVRPNTSTFLYSGTTDGNAFKPNAYRLNDDMPSGWRLPTLRELQRLPGWGGGKGACLGKLQSEMKMTLDPAAIYFAAYDEKAPDPVKSNASDTFLDVSGKVRFYSAETGDEVGAATIYNAGSPVTCLRVLDLWPNYISARGAKDASAFPSGDLRALFDYDVTLVESDIYLASGFPPIDVVVFDRVIDDPWYRTPATIPMMAAKKIHALSAVAIWGIRTRGPSAFVFCDVSGRVEWQTSDPSVARVSNTYNHVQKVADDAKAQGRFISPWYAPLTFSKAGTVTVTANWQQGIFARTPRNTVTITEGASADLCIPPVVTGVSVTPGGMLFTQASDLNNKQMSAYAAMSDSTAANITSAATWALLEVQIDANGNETGTTPLDPAVATIDQPTPGFAGGILRVSAGAGTRKRIRVVATDPASGQRGSADMVLQF